MPISIRSLYYQFCNCVNEGGGLQLDIVTDSDFLELLNGSVRDVFLSSFLYKRFGVELIVAGQREYEVKEQSVENQSSFVDYKKIRRNSAFFWQQDNARWPGELTGFPQEWSDDRIPIKVNSLRPIPNFTGPTVDVSSNFLGTISNVSSVIELNIQASAPFYGTISTQSGGDYYLEPDGPLYGTISNIAVGKGNLMQVYVTQQYVEYTRLDDVIELINVAFEPYVLFGILMRHYTTDSENKNNLLSNYFKTRFNEGLALMRTISGEVLLEV